MVEGLDYKGLRSVRPYPYNQLGSVFFATVKKIITFAVGKVIHDQLPLNSPRAGRQQG